MKFYEKLDEKKLIKEMNDFPLLDTKRCEQQANSLFKPWFFVKNTKDGRELSCSSCGRYGTEEIPRRTMDATWETVLYGRHDQKARCPWCGVQTVIKERRYIQRGVLLEEYQPVVYLDEKDGTLYAQAFWARKEYDSGMSAAQLAAAPLFRETAAYRFRLGVTDCYRESNWDSHILHEKVEGNLTSRNWIREPFTSGGGLFWRYDAYAVFNVEAIRRSAFRYCQYEQWRNGKEELTDGLSNGDFVKYMTCCTQYPRQMEMLMKAGLKTLVSDLVCLHKKNHAVIDWTQTDPRKAFRLSGDELKAWKASGASVYRIGDYKKFRKMGLPVEFCELQTFDAQIGYEQDTARKYCMKYKIRPKAMSKYLLAEIRREGRSFGAFHYWKDYVDTVEQLGYDLTDETVLLPKELRRKHDEAAEELIRRKTRIAREKAKKEREEAQKLIRGRAQKYTAELDGFFFRPAETSDEIIAEGKTLHHCVGGYAERHMQGKLTICFMRRSEAPAASLYTIEMRGDEMQQIHGINNIAPKPKAKAACDRWLLWIKRGSKRDKQGNPILPKIKEKKEVKTA